jgi:ABC-type uncharacterized transport system substrate-binding protein
MLSATTHRLRPLMGAVEWMCLEHNDFKRQRSAARTAIGFAIMQRSCLRLHPTVVLANATLSVGPMLQGVPNLAVVFVNVIDPVGQRFVTSLAKPGGNATGLSAFEFDFSGK